MNKNVKFALIGLGVLVVGYFGYQAYKKYRITSGNDEKDNREIKIITE